MVGTGLIVAMLGSGETLLVVGGGMIVGSTVVDVGAEWSKSERECGRSVL